MFLNEDSSMSSSYGRKQDLKSKQNKQKSEKNDVLTGIFL